MLQSLEISNFLLIKAAHINFSANLSVITGESGAGKSLVLDSLLVALGQKQPPTKQQSVITLCFEITDNDYVLAKLVELGINADDTLIIRRTLGANNKNYLNDVAVSVGTLKDIANNLIQIYTQHAQQSLLAGASYLDIVDNFASLGEQKSQLNALYHNYQKIAAKLEEIKANNLNYAKEQDYLQNLVLELETLNVQENEEAHLTNSRILLMNKEKILNVINAANKELANTSPCILNAQKTLIRQNNFSNINFDEIIDHLEKSAIELDLAVNSLDQMLSDLSGGNYELDEIEQRLFAIRAASRKYNISSNDFASFLLNTHDKLGQINQQEQIMQEHEKNLNLVKKQYFVLAKELSELRHAACKKLQEEVTLELKNLQMPYTTFIVELTAKEELALNGIDHINFMFSPNPGMQPTLLHKAASGGELSRFMLGASLVLSKIKQHTSLFFDEIDSGLSGSIADLVGIRLAHLAKNTQTIVITHQPQVAAKGDVHIHVSKMQSDQDTTSTLNILDTNQRITEIAKMISGINVSNEAMLVAQKLLVNC
jgi:DNA repair protein RecN (Recombination protein N)